MNTTATAAALRYAWAEREHKAHIFITDLAGAWQEALCGRVYHMPYLGWSGKPDPSVICARCRRALQSKQQREQVP